MEVRINKEVRDYQESLFFGLSLRQFLFALLAVLVAVGLYFGLRNVVGSGEIGWICVLAAFPFALCGFFTYNGMTFEKFLLAVIRSEPGKRYYERDLAHYLCSRLQHDSRHDGHGSPPGGGYTGQHRRKCILR